MGGKAVAHYLGIDIGHTKIKAGLFDATGAVVCHASHSTPFAENTVDPRRLWESVAACIRELIADSGVDSTAIAAVACSGHGNGLYALDADGNPLPTAYAATFDKAQTDVDALTQMSATEELSQYTMQQLWAGQPLPILAYLRREEPTVYAQIAHAFFCKDFINYCLCDEIATEYTDAGAAGVINVRTGDYDARIFDIFDLLPVFPSLKRSTDVVGYVTPQAAQQTGLAVGTPVAAGLFDAAAAFLGAGMSSAGECGMVSGTWGINAAVADALPTRQHFLQCVPLGDKGTYLYIESAPTSSVNLEWLLTQVFDDVDYRAADAIAAQFAADDVTALYMPYIYGRGGGFCHVTHRDNQRTLIRAVYEGVALGHKRQWEALTDSGVTPDRIVFIGGATNSEVWCQIFADVLGVPLCVPSVGNAGMLGNVMAASVAVGQFATVQQACAAMTPSYRTIEPIAANVDVYRKKYYLFKQLG